MPSRPRAVRRVVDSGGVREKECGERVDEATKSVLVQDEAHCFRGLTL